jgi:hypothetical protein
MLTIFPYSQKGFENPEILKFFETSLMSECMYGMDVMVEPTAYIV